MTVELPNWFLTPDQVNEREIRERDGEGYLDIVYRRELVRRLRELFRIESLV